MSLKFFRIVDAEDRLIPKAVVQSKQAEDSGMGVWCDNQHGDKVVAGTTTGLIQ